MFPQRLICVSVSTSIARVRIPNQEKRQVAESLPITMQVCASHGVRYFLMLPRRCKPEARKSIVSCKAKRNIGVWLSNDDAIKKTAMWIGVALLAIAPKVPLVSVSQPCEICSENPAYRKVVIC